MKGLMIASALVLGAALLPAGPAQAKGCLKGAVVGGTAGSFCRSSRNARRDGRLRGRSPSGREADGTTGKAPNPAPVRLSRAAAGSGASSSVSGHSEPGDCPSCERFPGCARPGFRCP